MRKALTAALGAGLMFGGAPAFADQLEECKALVAASSKKAQSQWRVCGSCHFVDPARKGGVGPNMYGVYGAPIAGNETFRRYSKDLQAKGEAGETWTDENLKAFIANARAFAPRTTMSSAPIRDEAVVDEILAMVKCYAEPEA